MINYADSPVSTLFDQEKIEFGHLGKQWRPIAYKEKIKMKITKAKNRR
jgi:hypothetical protein